MTKPATGKRPPVSFRLAPDTEIILAEVEKTTLINRSLLINKAIRETYSERVGKRVLVLAEKALEAA